MKKKILIVGGTGFIGYHLALKCLKLNWKVISISKNNPIKIRFINNIKYYKCDLSKKKSLLKVIKREKIDYIVNLGGYINHKNFQSVYEGHYLSVKHLINFFRKKKIKVFVQIGSSAEYGNLSSPHLESKKCKPKSIYGKIKLKATKLLLKANRLYKFPVTILRFYQIYGPKQKNDRFIPLLINACLGNREFFASHGKQRRDFLYVDDAVEAIIKTIRNSKTQGKIINIGNGNPINLLKIMNLVKKIVGGGKLMLGRIKLRKDEPIIIYPNINYAKQLLKWKPKISFLTGLRKTIFSYRNCS